MTESVQVPCSHCAAVVRVPSARLGEGPRCPQCHSALFQGHPIEAANTDAFERHISRGELPVVVDFWAPWCGPCRAMAPVFESAAQRMEPRVRFLKVNTDELPDLANRHGIRGIPTVIVFRQGKEVARQSGAMNSQQLQQWLSQAVA